VITGFRLAPGGAQARFGVTPDIATFAKAIANGFPVAAIAGKGEILDLFGKGVVHGGTFNAQPVAMAATLATLDALTPELFAGIETRGRRLMDGIAAELAAAGHKAVVTGWPQVFHVAFDLDAPARNWRDLAKMNRAKYVRFTAALLAHGVRALERGAWFMSAAHDDTIVDQTLAAVRKAARELEAA
jgi:glutamate-1-semialdehyde 2,1-aminomutase